MLTSNPVKNTGWNYLKRKYRSIKTFVQLLPWNPLYYKLKYYCFNNWKKAIVFFIILVAFGLSVTFFIIYQFNQPKIWIPMTISLLGVVIGYFIYLETLRKRISTLIQKMERKNVSYWVFHKLLNFYFIHCYLESILHSKEIEDAAKNYEFTELLPKHNRINCNILQFKKLKLKTKIVTIDPSFQKNCLKIRLVQAKI